MNFKVTHTAPFRAIMGGQITPINTTADGCAATLTTRYDALDYTNILTLAHFPMTVAIYEYEL